MATGAPGPNGVYQYGEDDSEATFSALLNKTASTADTQIGLDRARLAALEAAGRIVQVVSSVKTNEYSVALSAGAFSGNITGLTATITPKSATNKILVTVDTTLSRVDGRGIGGFRIVRNSTAIAIGDAAGSRPRMTSGAYNDYQHNSTISPASAQVLDSPATTSAVTYAVQLYGAGGTTFTLNRSGVDPDNTIGYRTVSTITLMEVVA